MSHTQQGHTTELGCVQPVRTNTLSEHHQKRESDRVLTTVLSQAKVRVAMATTLYQRETRRERERGRESEKEAEREEERGKVHSM